MKKSCLPGKIVLGILALLFLLGFALVPLMYDLLLPFKKVNFAQGVWNSPFVGMNNLNQLFGIPSFAGVIGNTLLVNWPPLVLATGLSFLSAWLVRAIKGPVGRAIWLMGAGLLSFLPAQLFVSPMVRAIVGNGVNPTLAYLFMCLLVFLRLAGPAALLGGAVSMYTAGGKGVFAGVFFFILYGLAGLLTNCSEAYYLHIATVDSTMTLSMYIYQISLLQSNLSMGAAANLLRILPQLVLAAAGFLAMLRLLKRPQPVAPQRTQKGLSLAGIILLCAGGALLLAFIVWGALDRGVLPTASTVSLAIAGCAYFTLFAVAGGLFSFQARKPVVVLVLLLLGTVGGGVAGQYLYVRNSLFNNPLPAAVYGALSLLPLAAGVAYLFYRGGRAAVVHTFPMVGMAVAALLTNHLNNSMYFNNREMMPYGGQAYLAMVESGTLQTPMAVYVLTVLCLGLWLASFAFLFKRRLTPQQIEALNQPRVRPAMAAPVAAVPGGQAYSGYPLYTAYPGAAPQAGYGGQPPMGYGQSPVGQPGQAPLQQAPPPYQPYASAPAYQPAPASQPVEPQPVQPQPPMQSPQDAAFAPPPGYSPAAWQPQTPDNGAEPQPQPTGDPQAPPALTASPAEPSPDHPDI